MCGIVGYYGNKNATEVVFNGLRKLEYRGYDSWGMSWIGDGLCICKHTGEIGKANPPPHISQCAIGHTRWATHGGVSETNAHPHISDNQQITLVHNGIIENFNELKEELKDYNFVSETDTEVLVKLIEHNLKLFKCPEKALQESLNKIKGYYAITALLKEHNLLVAARYKSPLTIGLNENEVFIASDVTAFLEHTDKVIYLEDHDLFIHNIPKVVVQ